MVLDYLYNDTESLKACMLAGRYFFLAARHHLFGCIVLSSYEITEHCIKSLYTQAYGSIVYHASRLDVGYFPMSQTENSWPTVVKACSKFSKTGKIKSMQWSEVDFTSLAACEAPALLGATSLSDTVTVLAFVKCRFPSIQDSTSTIRTFPYCSSLTLKSGNPRDRQNRSTINFH